MTKRAHLKHHLLPTDYEPVKLPYGSYKWTEEQWASWEKQRADEHARDTGLNLETNDGSGARRKMPIRYE